MGATSPRASTSPPDWPARTWSPGTGLTRYARPATSASDASSTTGARATVASPATTGWRSAADRLAVQDEEAAGVGAQHPDVAQPRDGRGGRRPAGADHV